MVRVLWLLIYLSASSAQAHADGSKLNLREQLIRYPAVLVVYDRVSKDVAMDLVANELPAPFMTHTVLVIEQPELDLASASNAELRLFKKALDLKIPIIPGDHPNPIPRLKTEERGLHFADIVEQNAKEDKRVILLASFGVSRLVSYILRQRAIAPFTMRIGLNLFTLRITMNDRPIGHAEATEEMLDLRQYYIEHRRKNARATERNLIIPSKEFAGDLTLRARECQQVLVAKLIELKERLIRLRQGLSRKSN